jgi:hypothetical protein
VHRSNHHATIRAAAAVLFLGAAACSGLDDVPAADAGADAGPPATPVVFDAVADPAVLTECLPDAPAEGVARAKLIACTEELLQGALAMGRGGDVLIENARVQFVIRSSAESATTLGAYGGGILDAAPRGAPDLVKEIFVGMDFSVARPSSIVITDAGGDGDARVRVIFDLESVGLITAALGVELEPTRGRGAIDYELRADEDVLRVTVQVTTREGTAAVFGEPALLSLLGGAMELMQPGNQVLEREGTAGNGAGAVLLGEGAEGALAFGLAPPSLGSVTHVVSINLLGAPDRLRLREGEVVTYEARVALGLTGAAAWNAFQGSGARVTVRGSAGDRVEVALPTGAPLVRTRLDAAGEAQVIAPPGTYGVRAGFDRWIDGPTEMVDPGGSVTVAAPPSGRLRVEGDVGGDPAAPVRVVVAARDGTEVLRFVAIGPTERRLPTGSYAVTVSHGMEHTLHEQDVVIAHGATVTVRPVLDRAIDTTNWVAGDFHLHTEMSTDSLHPVDDALRTIAAEGLEVVASTDHDFITDYGESLARAGVAGRLIVVAGDEVSTTVYGHLGGYPLRRNPGRAGAGAPVWFDSTPSEMFDALRAAGEEDFGGTIVQVNHPRLGGAGFFDYVELDRETGHAGAGVDPALDDFDFDVIEVWNGYTRGGNEDAFDDWLALRAAGRAFTMMGNSDSHSPELPSGYPRTYLLVPIDDIPSLTWSVIAPALRNADATVAAGIFVTAEVVGPTAGGMRPIHVRVQAPPWVETDRLRAYAGRDVAIDMPLDAGVTAAVRFDGVLDVPIGTADFVVIRADGTRPPEPVFRFSPFGVTNALRVR